MTYLIQLCLLYGRGIRFAEDVLQVCEKYGTVILFGEWYLSIQECVWHGVTTYFLNIYYNYITLLSCYL